MKRVKSLNGLVWGKSPWEKKSPAQDFITGTFWEMTKNAYDKLNEEEKLTILNTMFRVKEKEA